jgi:ribosome biogenesis GTPase
MHQIAGGAWIIDTPGMRSLGLVDVEGAIDDVFAEISVLAQRCKFIDCEHGSEPGCAVAAAIAAGEVAEERLARYRKLVAESRRNDASLADRRAREKSIGKLHKRIQHAKASRNRPD